MPPADPTQPPLTAEQLATLKAVGVAWCTEAQFAELLDAHAALTAKNQLLAGKLADIEADAQATTTTADQTPPLMADAAREVVSAWAYVHRGHLAHCLKSEISDCGFCKDVNHLMEACESLGNAKAHAARTTELDVLKWARREDAAEMQQDEMRYAADLAQRTAERDALQARIDAANSVDGVTADDAPLMIDALAPAAAWVEGVQHGQEMALAALAAPTEG